MGLLFALYVALIPLAYSIIFAGWQRNFKSIAYYNRHWDTAVSLFFALCWPLTVPLSLLSNGWQGMLLVSEAKSYRLDERYPTLYGPGGEFRESFLNGTADQIDKEQQ